MKVDYPPRVPSSVFPVSLSLMLLVLALSAPVYGAETAPAASPALSPELTEALKAVNQRRIDVHTYGMLTLGVWAVSNIAVGVWQDATANQRDETAFFHQGNWGWNTVNLALATIGIINGLSADPAEDDYLESLDRAKGVELAFLINGMLDFAYISSGAWLWERGHRTEDPRLGGYGRALILQGGFLLTFDAVMYILSRSVTSDLTELPIQLIPTPTGAGLAARF